MITKNIKDLPPTSVSHNPEIAKKTIIPHGLIPKLTTFSQAYFEQGQVCHEHTHHDMWEVYFVNSGILTMTCNGVGTEHHQGATVVIEPGDSHSASNQHGELLVTTYFGIEQ